MKGETLTTEETTIDDVRREALSLTTEQMIIVRQRLKLETAQDVIRDMFGVVFAALVARRIREFGVTAATIAAELMGTDFMAMCDELGLDPFEEDADDSKS